MLVCKVIIGDCCIGQRHMVTPPFKPNSVLQYDSMVDDLNNPSIFVVTKDYHAIPVYSITYKPKRFWF